MAAYESPVLTPVVDIPGASALQGLDTGVKATAAWIANRHNLIRIGWFVAGYAMIIAGLVILTKPAVTETVGVVTSTAGKAAKAVT